MIGYLHIGHRSNIFPQVKHVTLCLQFKYIQLLNLS